MDGACIFAYKQMKKQSLKDLGWFQAQYHLAFLITGAALGFISSTRYGL